MRGRRAPGPGRLWKRDRQWILDWRDESGTRRRKALGTEKWAAERRRAEIIRQRDMALDGLGAAAGQERTLRELADLYLADLEPRASALHAKYLRQRLDRIVSEIGVERVADLKPLHAIALRTRVVAGGNGHRTANLYVSSLQAMLRWAVENELVGKNPVERIKRLPEGPAHRRYQRRAMTEEEIAAFLAAAEADDRENEGRASAEGWRRVPQTPLWVAFLETGARWNELRTATWGDLDLRRRVLTLRASNTKSGKARAIPLREGLVDRLRALRVLHETVLGRIPTVRDRVFLTPEGCAWGRPTNNVMRIFRRLLERAGIARVDEQGGKLDIHALRHTAATRLARQGVPLVQAQRLLGHSDPKLTAQAYTHLEADDLRGAVEALPPLSSVPDQQREAR